MDTFTIYQKDIAKAREFDKVSDQIVIQNLPLVVFLARRFHKAHTEVDMEELVAAGNIGLLKAAPNYDASRKSKETFSTYASAVIYREFLRVYVDHLYRGVRVPRKTYHQVREVQTFLEKQGRFPSISEASSLFSREVRLDSTRWQEIRRAYVAFQNYDQVPSDMICEEN